MERKRFFAQRFFAFKMLASAALVQEESIVLSCNDFQTLHDNTMLYFSILAFLHGEGTPIQKTIEWKC
jgi:hypothetical protein